MRNDTRENKLKGGEEENSQDIVRREVKECARRYDNRSESNQIKKKKEE